MTATTRVETAGLTATLVEWVARVSYDDLPSEVVHAARRAILDSIGVTVGGSTQPAATILLDLADTLGGAPAATIVGHRRRTDVVTATVVNGVMAHVLDFDDTFLPTRIHASAPLLPALLAVGESRGRSYREVIVAFVVGMELQSRLALAMYPDYADRGWHGTGVVGPFSVALAAGRLLGLDETQLAHAAGLGATQGAGITSMFGSMAKSHNLGRAGGNGVLSALLAERGFTSNPSVLEAGRGFFSRYSDVLDHEVLVGGLGERWAVLDDGFKPYACGLVAHAAIDGVLELRETTGLAPEDVAGLHLRVPPESLVLMGNMTPTTELEAKFSVAYSAAGAYIDGGAGPATFEDERVADPHYRALLSRVSVQGDAELRQDEAVITLTAAAGTHEVHIEHALGTQLHPMTDDQLAAKFEALVAPVLGADRAASLVHSIWTLDREPVSELTSALVPAPEESR